MAQADHGGVQVERGVGSWDRLLWGVYFVSPGNKPILIGTRWMDPAPEPHYLDEPTRPILFKSRITARNWCKEKLSKYEGRNDCC